MSSLEYEGNYFKVKKQNKTKTKPTKTTWGGQYRTLIHTLLSIEC